MNTGDAPLKPALAGEPGSDESPSAPGRGLAALALLLALAAVAGSGWLWWTEYRTQGDAAARQSAETDRIGQMEAAVGSRLQAIEAQLVGLAQTDSGTRVSVLEQRLQALEAEAREASALQSETAAWSRTIQAGLEGGNARLAGLEARFDAFAARGLDSRAEMDLAELDFLLRLAQERLELFGDVRSADRALALADAHVAAFDNPLFGGLRREIATARRALAVIDLPDPATLDRELDSVQDRLATLPFRGADLGGGDSAPEAATGWWARLKAVFSGLVTVRRSTEDLAQLPALADQELVRQRAWLEVERVRLAAMRRDAGGYAVALQRARSTIEHWFEPRDRGTRAALQSLESAAALEVDPELPDISAPWSALRALRATDVPGLAPEPAPDSVPEPAPEPSQSESAVPENEGTAGASGR